jgi:hypothetical protein
MGYKWTENGLAKSYWTQNVCVDFLYSSFLKHFSFYEELSEIWKKCYWSLCSVFCPILMKLEISGQVFEKYWNINFYENPPSGPKLFHADGRTDGRTNVTKLIVAFRNFANAPKTVHSICVEAGANMLLIHDINPDFRVMDVTTLIKFQLLQWP